MPIPTECPLCGKSMVGLRNKHRCVLRPKMMDRKGVVKIWPLKVGRPEVQLIRLAKIAEHPVVRDGRNGRPPLADLDGMRPWEALDISRRTWFRKRREARWVDDGCRGFVEHLDEKIAELQRIRAKVAGGG